MGAEARIQEMKLNLPNTPRPLAKYRPALRVGNLLHLSGHLPAPVEGLPAEGAVGKELTVEQGKQAARAVGLAVLATIRAEIGSLDKVKRLVRTLGVVNCPAGFSEQPQVINGFSEFMAEVFGDEAGVGTRSAIGASSLPRNVPVEIECVFEIQE